MDRRSAAKGVTASVSGRTLVDARATLDGHRCRWGLAVRPLAPVRSTGRPAGEGNTRGLTGARWWPSGGRGTGRAGSTGMRTHYDSVHADPTATSTVALIPYASTTKHISSTMNG